MTDIERNAALAVLFGEDRDAPRDFTRPGVLAPLAERLLQQWNADYRDQYYMWTHTFLPLESGTAHAVQISYCPWPYHKNFRDTHSAGYGEGSTYEVALGIALLDAITED